MQFWTEFAQEQQQTDHFEKTLPSRIQTRGETLVSFSLGEDVQFCRRKLLLLLCRYPSDTFTAHVLVATAAAAENVPPLLDRHPAAAAGQKLLCSENFLNRLGGDVAHLLNAFFTV
jgi:hypothetical protein